MMNIKKEKTVAFSGYRIRKMILSQQDTNLLNVIRTELRLIIKSLYKDGYNIFLSGMSKGFELMAAEVVLELRQSYPEIQLYAIVPFKGQEFYYSDQDKKCYWNVFDNANHVEIISENNDDKALFLTNQYLLANSSFIVCYYEGVKSGTITYNNIYKEKLLVINIYELLLPYFANESRIKTELQKYSHLKNILFSKEGVIINGTDGECYNICFEDIIKIAEKEDRLCLTLNNGISFRISLFGAVCDIKFPGK